MAVFCVEHHGYQTERDNELSLSDFDLDLCRGGYTLRIRLIGSLTGQKAVNGYPKDNGHGEILRRLPAVQNDNFVGGPHEQSIRQPA